MLEAIDVTRHYTRGTTPFAAVDGVSLRVEGGEFVNVLGRSGSGKSTLLSLFAGLLQPTSGAVRVLGQDLQALGDTGLSALRNDRLGIVPQGQSALRSLTVLENVALPHLLLPRAGDGRGKAMALLERLGIGHLAHSFPRELSGGELRRMAIARALINAPALLLADEPTSDLDAETTAQVLTLFRERAREGAAVIVVTHDRDALAYGTRACTMDAGILRPLATD